MTIRFGIVEGLTPLTRNAVVNAGGALVVLLLGAAAIGQVLGLSAFYLPKAAAAFSVASAILFGFLSAHRPHPRLGSGNQVTLFRAVLTALLFGLIGEGGAAPVAWTAFLLALIAESLDGVDGWLARRGGWVSPFGARFDMETDALMVAVLALLVWSLGKAGIWVLAAGLLRYLFAAAGLLIPWMRGHLPPSRRRQAACVMQILSLTLAMVPLLPPEQSSIVAGAGLVLLCYSFAVDTLWLARSAGPASESGERP